MVATGSRAEQGSSMRITSGLTAMVRAMHRRCCCPPERRERALLELVLDLVPQRRVAQALLDQVVHLGDLHPVDTRTERDVVVDRLRERVRLLEHHADTAAQLDRVDGSVVQARAPVPNLAGDSRTGNEVGHPIQAPQERRLPAARGPDQRGDPVGTHGQRHVVQRPERAVEEVEARDVEDRLGLGLGRDGRAGAVGARATSGASARCVSGIASHDRGPSSTAQPAEAGRERPCPGRFRKLHPSFTFPSPAVSRALPDREAGGDDPRDDREDEDDDDQRQR